MTSRGHHRSNQGSFEALIANILLVHFDRTREGKVCSSLWGCVSAGEGLILSFGLGLGWAWAVLLAGVGKSFHTGAGWRVANRFRGFGDLELLC
jgi:hypothetical protein